MKFLCRFDDDDDKTSWKEANEWKWKDTIIDRLLVIEKNIYKLNKKKRVECVVVLLARSDDAPVVN